jgi:hypothetical protein
MVYMDFEVVFVALDLDEVGNFEVFGVGLCIVFEVACLEGDLGGVVVDEVFFIIIFLNVFIIIWGIFIVDFFGVIWFF